MNSYLAIRAMVGRTPFWESMDCVAAQSKTTRKVQDLSCSEAIVRCLENSRCKCADGRSTLMPSPICKLSSSLEEMSTKI